MEEHKNFTVLEWIVVNLKFWNKDLHPEVIKLPASKLLPDYNMYISPLQGNYLVIRLSKGGETFSGELELFTSSEIIASHRAISSGTMQVVIHRYTLKRALESVDQIITLRYRTAASEESSKEQVVTIINGVNLSLNVPGDMWGQIRDRLLAIHYQTDDGKLHKINVNCWFQYPEFKFSIGSEKWENKVFVSTTVSVDVEGEVAKITNKEIMFNQRNIVDFGFSFSLVGSKLNEDKLWRLCVSFIIIPKANFTHCESFGHSKFDVVSEKNFCVEISEVLSYSPSQPHNFNIEPSNSQLPATTNHCEPLTSMPPFNIQSQSRANPLQWQLSVPQSNCHLQSSANHPALQMGLPPCNYYLQFSANPSGQLMMIPTSNSHFQPSANPSGLQAEMSSSNYQLESSANLTEPLTIQIPSDSYLQPCANPPGLQMGMPPSNYYFISSANPSGLLMVKPTSNSHVQPSVNSSGLLMVVPPSNSHVPL